MPQASCGMLRPPRGSQMCLRPVAQKTVRRPAELRQDRCQRCRRREAVLMSTHPGSWRRHRWTPPPRPCHQPRPRPRHLHRRLRACEDRQRRLCHRAPVHRLKREPALRCKGLVCRPLPERPPARVDLLQDRQVALRFSRQVVSPSTPAQAPSCRQEGAQFHPCLSPFQHRRQMARQCRLPKVQGCRRPPVTLPLPRRPRLRQHRHRTVPRLKPLVR